LDNVLLIIALLPFVFIFVGLAGFKIRGRYVGPLGWLLAMLLAFVFWKTPVFELLDLSATGFVWTALTFIWSMFGAFFLLNFLLDVGIIEEIKKALISESKPESMGIYAILIGFALAILLGSIAPGGTNFAITSTMLCAGGMDPFSVGVSGLFGNGVQSPYGTLGLSVYSLSQVTGLNLGNLTSTIALMMIPFIITAPLWMILLLKIKLTKKIVFSSLLVGSFHAVTVYYVGLLLGPELPNLVAGAVSMLVCILLLRFYDKKKLKISARAVSPFIVVFGLILLTRLVQPIEDVLTQPALQLKLNFATGGTVSFPYFYSPGTLMIIATIISAPLIGEKYGKLYISLKKTVWQILPILVSTSSYVALSYVMEGSGMILLLAEATVLATGIFYPFFSPVVGMLGCAVTGSTSASNIFFGSFQTQVARGLNLSQVTIASSQTIGSMAGEIISPLNAVVVATPLGVKKEGVLIRKTMLSGLLYLLMAGLITYLFSRVFI